MGLSVLRERKNKAAERVVEGRRLEENAIEDSNVFGVESRQSEGNQVYAEQAQSERERVYRDYEEAQYVDVNRAVHESDRNYQRTEQRHTYRDSYENDYADYAERTARHRGQIDYRNEPIVDDMRYAEDRRFVEPSYREPQRVERERRYVEESRVDSRFQHMDHNGVMDRRMTTVTSLEVPTVSEFNYSNPDNYGLQVLGLSSSEKVKLIKPRALEVKPIEISNIVDSTGKVAAKLLNYMDKTTATVLPLRECGVFENIVDIKGFKIIEVRGKKFASYCGVEYPTVYLEKLINKIVNRISSAMPFGVDEDLDGIGGYVWNKEESRLSRIVTINGREVEVPALCNSEIEYICARLRPYNCNIIDVVNDFSHIIVGVDLEGVGFGEREL